MKKIVSTLILLVSLLFTAIGQRSESEIALREYFIDAEFFMAQEFYMDALNDYLQVYKRGYKDNANINYRIGLCYLHIPGQKDKSIPYLEVARQSASPAFKESTLNEKKAPIDVYLYLGNAYRVVNQLDKAVDSYLKYKELLPEDELKLHKYADKQIEACNIANEFMESPVSLKFINLGEKINSSNDDYKAVISGDGSTLVYMHRLPFYDAVYFSKIKDGEWTEPENITSQLLSDGNQFVASLSYDGKTLLLTREDEFNSDIMISHYEDNRWTVSQSLGSNINTKYWESHACLSKDGKTLYFASNRTKGVGEMDLYRSQMLPEGIFGVAENLSTLNTDLNEDTPFITDDGTKLFFSSQGFTSMGGYDIFVSIWDGSSWGLPKNLGYPISTTDDDLFYYPLNDGEAALMARIEDDGFGGTDIYKIAFEEKPIALQEEKAVKTLDESTETDEGTEIITKVDEEKTATADETVALTETEEPVKKAVVKDEVSEETQEAVEETTVAEPLVEKKVQIIDLKPVLFGFDKASLTTEGMNELDKVARLMKANPKIEVVLTGFTDPLGPENYNLILSQKRAQTTLNYLLSKGVDAVKLTAVGRGETNFIAVNTYPNGRDNPQGRMYNRRVEFEIKGMNTEEMVIHRIDPVPPDLRAR